MHLWWQYSKAIWYDNRSVVGSLPSEEFGVLRADQDSLGNSNPEIIIESTMSQPLIGHLM